VAKNFVLHDWNDIRLLLAVADRGSFHAAARALGVDQTTVSKRIAYLEEEMGRPLFRRRRSGARPTVAGLAVLSRAQSMASGAAQIEHAIRGLTVLPPPVITIAATAGLLEFTVKPALRGEFRAEFEIDRRQMAGPLPPLAYSSDPRAADIVIHATAPGDMPRGTGRVRIRRAGRMTFVPVASREYLKQHGAPAKFDALADASLLDIAIYRGRHGLDPWNEVVAGAERLVMFPNTPEIEAPLLAGLGITVLAPYAELYDRRFALVEMPVPDMSVTLWVAAHEDTLREPAARQVYNLLADTFQSSPFFGRR
jgi:DNA-binding transcriptional LysR family regulator